MNTVVKLIIKPKCRQSKMERQIENIFGTSMNTKMSKYNIGEFALKSLTYHLIKSALVSKKSWK
jgi:hypothetical protein